MDGLIFVTTGAQPGLYAAPPEQEEEARPSIYTAEQADGNTLIICNGDDELWRAPVDELKDMAREVEEENARSEHRLSWEDRRKAIQERWLAHAERRLLAKRRAFQNFAKGR